MKDQMHLAAQYLAAAGISFLEKKEDDSHTNLGFNINNGTLETHPLSKNGDLLLLNYKEFSLQWLTNKELITFSLDGQSHKEVLKWLTETAKSTLNKDYTYNLHYDLPYEISDAYNYELQSISELNILLDLRRLAQRSLEKINEIYGLNASIRVWPHHFDTGIYSQLPSSNISVGLGLAIPDNVCREHYLYISGYEDNDAIDPSGFNKLKNGEWKHDDFTGAILPATKITETEAIDFFKEAIHNYKS